MAMQRDLSTLNAEFCDSHVDLIVFDSQNDMCDSAMPAPIKFWRSEKTKKVNRSSTKTTTNLNAVAIRKRMTHVIGQEIMKYESASWGHNNCKSTNILPMSMAQCQCMGTHTKITQSLIHYGSTPLVDTHPDHRVAS
jgi:hypothetical protein